MNAGIRYGSRGAPFGLFGSHVFAAHTDAVEVALDSGRITRTVPFNAAGVAALATIRLQRAIPRLCLVWFDIKVREKYGFALQSGLTPNQAKRAQPLPLVLPIIVALLAAAAWPTKEIVAKAFTVPPYALCFQALTSMNLGLCGFFCSVH